MKALDEYISKDYLYHWSEFLSCKRTWRCDHSFLLESFLLSFFLFYLNKKIVTVKEQSDSPFPLTVETRRKRASRNARVILVPAQFTVDLCSSATKGKCVGYYAKTFLFSSHSRLSSATHQYYLWELEKQDIVFNQSQLNDLNVSMTTAGLLYL